MRIQITYDALFKLIYKLMRHCYILLGIIYKGLKSTPNKGPIKSIVKEL